MNRLTRTFGPACAIIAAMALTANAGGLVLKQKTSTDSKDRASKSQDGTAVISVQGKCMRLDYEQTNDSNVKKGDYIVSNDGESFYMVSTKEKQYMKFDFAMAGGMMSLMSMKISDPKSQMVSDEAGPKMLGYPTRHVKYTVSYTMEMSIMGMKTKNQIVQETESWVTTKIDASAFEAWSRSFAAKGGNKDMEELMKATMKNIKGVPLKNIVLTTTTDKNGKKTTSTTTSEVTEVKEGSLPAKLFELPSDYKEIDLSAMGAPREVEEKDSGAGSEPAESSEPQPKAKRPSLSDMLKMMR